MFSIKLQHFYKHSITLSGIHEQTKDKNPIMKPDHDISLKIKGLVWLLSANRWVGDRPPGVINVCTKTWSCKHTTHFKGTAPLHAGYYSNLGGLMRKRTWPTSSSCLVSASQSVHIRKSCIGLKCGPGGCCCYHV